MRKKPSMSGMSLLGAIEYKSENVRDEFSWALMRRKPSMLGMSLLGAC